MSKTSQELGVDYNHLKENSHGGKKVSTDVNPIGHNELHANREGKTADALSHESAHITSHGSPDKELFGASNP